MDLIFLGKTFGFVRNKSCYLKMVIQCYAVHVQVEGFKPTFFTSQNPYQPCKPPIHEGSMEISLVKSITKSMMSLYFVVACGVSIWKTLWVQIIEINSHVLKLRIFRNHKKLLQWNTATSVHCHNLQCNVVNIKHCLCNIYLGRDIFQCKIMCLPWDGKDGHVFTHPILWRCINNHHLKNSWVQL